MNKNFKTLIILIVVFVSVAQAQENYYNPLLDPAVRIIKEPPATSGAYLWYPGQLSAHLQGKRFRESEARCVNVGYPGNFYIPTNQVFVKKEVRFAKPTTVEWYATGKVTVLINGKPATTDGNTLQVAKGKSTLTFQVQTERDLPAIRIMSNGQHDIQDWQASLDGTYWNLAETSPVFGRGNSTPLDDPERHLSISPKTILPVRNAWIAGDKSIIGKNGYILIDFFHLEVGAVSLRAKGQGTLTAFVGESPEETLDEDTSRFEQRPIDSFALSSEERTITLPERAVRYVKLACDQGCEVSAIDFKAKIWPVDLQMSFECNDERINNIWNASVASLLTSMHGFYLDGVKRDYLPWSMDAVLSTFGGDYVFADKQVSLNSLSVAMLPLHPQKSDVGIPDYPLHALIGFKQHYLRYGDFKTILSYRDRMEQLLRFYETLQDDRGFISANVGVSWGFVPGWATKRGPDRKGTPTYAQIMLYQNYRIGADFSEKWGDKKAARHYQEKAAALKEAIFQYFWDADRKLFINGYAKNGELDKGISHHAQYWAILADIFPEEHYDTLFETLPKIAYYKDYVSFEKGYEFLAYAKARRTRDMWRFLMDVFGDWLEQGHTRFPENFSYRASKDQQLLFYSRPYGLSLCHGANGVPGIVGILHGIAGFSQSDKHPAAYTLRPDLMDLEWVNVEFPVKEGKIKLRLTKEGRGEIEIPAGCTVTYNDGDKSVRFAQKGVYKL